MDFWLILFISSCFHWILPFYFTLSVDHFDFDFDSILKSNLISFNGSLTIFANTAILNNNGLSRFSFTHKYVIFHSFICLLVGLQIDNISFSVIFTYLRKIYAHISSTLDWVSGARKTCYFWCVSPKTETNVYNNMKNKPCHADKWAVSQCRCRFWYIHKRDALRTQ